MKSPNASGSEHILSSTKKILLLTALSGALAACGGEAPTGQAPSVPTVEVIKLQAQPVEITSELAGRTKAFRVAEIRPQVGGILKARSFEEGQTVEDGQVLYEIDPDIYEANLAAAKGQLSQAQAALGKASRHYNRQQSLLKVQAVSEQSVDAARSEYEQAKAQKEIAEASVRMAQINLDHTKITAPIAGRISYSAITEGALLSANQAQSLTTIQQLDPMYVDLTQSSKDLLLLRSAIKNGDLKGGDKDRIPVTLKLEDGSTYPHEGFLQFSDSQVDQGTGMVTLRAIFPNPDEVLLPGMYVKAALSAGIKENALLVPQQAVTRSPMGEAVVLLVNEEGVVERRAFESSRVIDQTWMVDAGLQVGETVIVKGVQKAQPGSKVNVEPWADGLVEQEGEGRSNG